MSLIGWGLARIAKLDKPLTRKLVVDRDLRVPLADGSVCLADRYAPANAGDGLPLVLIRTPYGRRSQRGYAEVFASRGYQVLVQACRGTDGSTGTFLPFQTDREDGAATVTWLRQQPWFGGTIGMFGPSYMGYVQWAVAADFPREVRALSIQIGTSDPRQMMYPGGAFSLKTMLSWAYLVSNQAKGRSPIRIASSRKRDVPRAYDVVPLRDCDRSAIGEHFEYFQDLLASERADAPLWKQMDCSDRVAEVTAGVHSLTGWWDIFLVGQLADHERRQAAGRTGHLTIGPWGHTSPGWLGPALRATLRLFDAHLREGAGPDDPPVRIHLMGAEEWLDLPEWPPATDEHVLHLRAGGSLAPEPGDEAGIDRYRYDPADPTPDAGGNADPEHGARDNRRREARPDVLTYTTELLPDAVDVVGRATARLVLRSSVDHHDVVVRLCDVSPKGRSTNVCDGIVRLGPPTRRRADGTRHVELELWPTAHRFAAGHRLRLQVSSGAHPRINRNLGSGEPLLTATEAYVSVQEVLHGPDHPSHVALPVLRA